MKKTVIPLIIIGLLLYASFGLIMVNHMDGMGHNICPFEAVGLKNCVNVQNPLDFVASHLDVFSKFFSAIPINGFAVSLALLFAFALGVLVIFNSLFEIHKFQRLRVINRLHEFFVSPNKNRLTRWFALHENSPSLITGR